MVFRASGIQANSMGHCQINRVQYMCSQHVNYFTQCSASSSARTVWRLWNTPRRAARRTLCATGTATSGAELQGRKYSSSVQYATRLATTADFWAIAEVHAQSFYPNADWLFGPLLRLDRVCALQMGIDADVKQGQGRFACLLAQDLDATDVSSFSEPVFGAFPGASVPPFFKFLLAKHLQVGFSLSPERLGLLGTVVVDMQGQHLPQERVEKGPIVAYKPQENVAYISNLAVSPAARRMGVGEELLKAAEKVAMDWGCKTICLHCDPLNEAASSLYKKHGYAGVRTQMNWLSWAGGTPRLQLMQKTVT